MSRKFHLIATFLVLLAFSAKSFPFPPPEGLPPLPQIFSPEDRVGDPLPLGTGKSPEAAVPGNVLQRTGEARREETDQYTSQAGKGKGQISAGPGKSDFGKLGSGQSPKTASDQALVKGLSQFLDQQQPAGTKKTNTAGNGNRPDPDSLVESNTRHDKFGHFGEYADGTPWRRDNEGRRWLYEDRSPLPTHVWDEESRAWQPLPVRVPPVVPNSPSQRDLAKTSENGDAEKPTQKPNSDALANRADPFELTDTQVDEYGTFGHYADGTAWRIDWNGRRWLYTDGSPAPTYYWDNDAGGWVYYRPNDPGETIEVVSPEILISRHTKLRNLDESGLGKVLMSYAAEGSHEYVNDVLDALDWTDRDDVALAMLKHASDERIQKVESTETGRQLNSRLYHELTEANAADEEIQQAERLLLARANHLPVTQFSQQVEKAMILPFRQGGPTVLHSASINAKLLPNGKIHVEMPYNETRAKMFESLVKKLPDDLFLSGIEIDSTQIIGVKDFATGQTQYWPALYLIQVSNRSDAATLGKIAAVSALGFSLGVGTIAGETGVLLWAQRAETTISSLSLFVNDHRGWIAEELGEGFLSAFDKVDSAARIYGGARAIYAFAKTAHQLSASYKIWRQGAGKVLSKEADKLDEIMDRVTGVTLKTDSLPYPASTGTVASSGGTFMNRQLKRITSDPNHPLKFLVDPKTGRWKGRTHLTQQPTVQAGHLTSRHSGAPERFALEDSFFNQVSNWRGETQGAIFMKTAVEIGGIAVEARTAAMWRSLGLLE